MDQSSSIDWFIHLSVVRLFAVTSAGSIADCSIIDWLSVSQSINQVILWSNEWSTFVSLIIWVQAVNQYGFLCYCWCCACYYRQTPFIHSLLNLSTNQSIYPICDPSTCHPQICCGLVFLSCVVTIFIVAWLCCSLFSMRFLYLLKLPIFYFEVYFYLGWSTMRLRVAKKMHLRARPPLCEFPLFVVDYPSLLFLVHSLFN